MASQKKRSRPSLAQVTRWFRALVASGSYPTRYGVQAFFYDAIYSNDAAIERVFETWASSVSSRPRQLVEAELVAAEGWGELHAFFTQLTPAQLAAVVPKIEAFVAAPGKQARRYREVVE